MKIKSPLKALLRVVSVTILVTSCPAFAENDISPSSEPVLPANWELRRTADSDAIELISRVPAGALSTMCSDGGCGVFVEPASGCVPGAKYPLLINSAKQVGIVPTECAMIPADEEGKMRYVVLLRDKKTLMKAMMEETDITIAFPTQEGQMDVITVSMAGVRQALTQILPSMPAPAANDDAKPRAAGLRDVIAEL